MSQVKRYSGMIAQADLLCSLENVLPSMPTAKCPSSIQLFTKSPPEQPRSSTLTICVGGYRYHNFSLNLALVDRSRRVPQGTRWSGESWAQSRSARKTKGIVLS